MSKSGDCAVVKISQEIKIFDVLIIIFLCLAVLWNKFLNVQKLFVTTLRLKPFQCGISFKQQKLGVFKALKQGNMPYNR